MKVPFITKEEVEKIAEWCPTPFHIYDEKGIRENARKLNKAFSWNKGYKEYFAVKATPNPTILKILHEEGCGTDCSSLAELVMSERCGIVGEDIMFSSNDTPAEEFTKAAELGAFINLDDFTHIEYLKNITGIPKKIFCRFNPGGVFSLGESKEGFQVMDNPGDAKYGMTEEQLIEAFRQLSQLGAEEYGIHSFLASNTVTNDYYPELAAILFRLAVKVKKETGVSVSYINLSGGVGVAYKPDQTDNDIMVIGEGVRKKFEEILVPEGLGDVSIFTELGRFMLAPYGALVTKAIHEKRFWCRQVLTTSPSLRSWDAICWLPTDSSSPSASISSISIKNISEWMHVLQILCALPCMALIIILLFLVRKMKSLNINMM